MDLENTRSIINNVINNEFDHIQETQEDKEISKDIKISERSKKYNDLLNELIKVVPEYGDLIDELDAESAVYWTMLCRYYFKKGVVAGTTNLEFIKNTQIMHLI